MNCFSCILVFLIAMTVLHAEAAKIHAADSQEAKEHSYPWMLSLQTSEGDSPGHECGASLLRSPCNDYESDIILTLPTCFPECRNQGKKPITIKAGNHKHSVIEDGEEERTMAEVRCHIGDFIPPGIGYGIAVGRLNRPVRFSATIQPVVLARSDDTIDSASCKLAGWGDFSDRTKPDALQEVDLNMNTSYCEQNFGSEFNKTLEMCAERESYACYNDRGSPLICSNKNGKIRQYGVLVGALCRTPSILTFTRVNAHMTWIEKQIIDLSACKSGVDVEDDYDEK